MTKDECYNTMLAAVREYRDVTGGIRKTMLALLIDEAEKPNKEKIETQDKVERIFHQDDFGA